MRGNRYVDHVQRPRPDAHHPRRDQGPEERVADRLRGEVRFPSPDALVAQIKLDVARAREILARIPA